MVLVDPYLFRRLYEDTFSTPEDAEAFAIAKALPHQTRNGIGRTACRCRHHEANLAAWKVLRADAGTRQRKQAERPRVNDARRGYDLFHDGSRCVLVRLESKPVCSRNSQGRRRR